MRTLVPMTDEEREQVVDDFWNDVGENPDVPAARDRMADGYRPIPDIVRRIADAMGSEPPPHS